MKPLLSALVALGALVVLCTAAPAEDEVTDLPGLPYQPSFKQYSGYLDGLPGNHLHYWFVEAETVDPATAPVVFWFNGGPGCSSVFGFLTENGPFHVNDDGQTLYYNDYSWNQVANVLFLESPAGVGYSYTDDNTYITNDDETAHSNYLAVQSFFSKFPEYQANPFFVTGESYAGIYVPTLSVLIVNGSANINFQGFAVGNGLHDDKMNFNSEVLFNAYHGLHDQTIMNQMLTYCCEPTTPVTCDFYDPLNVDCATAVVDAFLHEKTSGINVYGVYDYCATSVPSQRRRRYATSRWQHMPKSWPKDYIEKLSNLNSDPPCENSWPERTWMNSPDVKAALHISDQATHPWDSCSDYLIYGEVYTSMTEQYNYLLSHVRAMIYHGDTDTMCNFIGGQWFVESLGREVLNPYRPWVYGNQTAGFVKDFNNITYVTVLGSGHMVPEDRPAQALQMFTNFLNNEPFT